MEQSGCSRCKKEKKNASGERTGRPELPGRQELFSRPESFSRQELFDRRISYALRGIAILMVMASHYGEWYAEPIGIPALSRFLMGLGRYGVDIFFLMSGYAMAKSAAAGSVTAGSVTAKNAEAEYPAAEDRRKGKPGRAFWIKRLRGTYIPYLILAGIIEICAGGAVTPARAVRYLLAQDYWFICNIMVLYLFFFAAFQFRRLRIVLLTLLTAAFTVLLYASGRQDFWYVSNLAFPLGAACGLYEKRLLAWMKGKRLWIVPAATLLCILLVPAAMRERALLLQTGGRGRLQPAANTLFSLWIALLPWPGQRLGTVGRRVGGVLRFFGKNSLYLYLLHPFLYYQTAGRWGLGAAGSFAVAFGSAVLGAWLFSLLWKAVSAKRSAAAKGTDR